MFLQITKLFAVLVFTSLFATNSMASPSDNALWKIKETQGTVFLTKSSGEKVNAQVGASLKTPFTVNTGKNGNVVMTQGLDNLKVMPNSQLRIPSSDSSKSVRTDQTAGSVLYQVKPRVKVKFSVTTPYLVSVVKGTTFNILVTEDATTAALIEGSLLVHTPDKKLSVLLKPGQTATKSKLSDEIVVKDQESLSDLRQGPITILNSQSNASGEANVTTSTTIGGEANLGVDLDSADTSLNVNIDGSGVSADASVLGGTATVGSSAGSGGASANVGSSAASTGASIGGSSIGGSSISAGASVGGTSVSAGVSTTTVTTPEVVSTVSEIVATPEVTLP